MSDDLGYVEDVGSAFDGGGGSYEEATAAGAALGESAAAEAGANDLSGYEQTGGEWGESLGAQGGTALGQALDAEFGLGGVGASVGGAIGGAAGEFAGEALGHDVGLVAEGDTYAEQGEGLGGIVGGVTGAIAGPEGAVIGHEAGAWLGEEAGEAMDWLTGDE